MPASLKALLEDYARAAGIPRSTAIVLAVEMALPSMLAELKNHDTNHRSPVSG